MISEGLAQYQTADTAEDEILRIARGIARKRVVRKYKQLGAPSELGAMLCDVLLGHEFEVFGMLYLDARHHGITFEEIFRGNLTGAAVYVGDVVKRSLRWNSAAVVAVHNHPSGIAEPSHADRELTERLRQALALVEIRLLDHVVVASDGTYVSFSERGWL
jgi:DNA repair protein RadC